MPKLYSLLMMVFEKIHNENKDFIEKLEAPERSVLFDTFNAKTHKSIDKNLEKQNLLKITEIGKKAANIIMNFTKDKVIINSKGHSFYFLEKSKNFFYQIHLRLGRASISYSPKEKVTESIFEDFLYNIFLLEEDNKGNLVFKISENESCSECGITSNFAIDINTFQIFPFHSLKDVNDCEFKEGLNEYNIKFKINSGKLIISNDFTHLMPKYIKDEVGDYLERNRNIDIFSNASIAHKMKADFYSQFNIGFFPLKYSTAIFLNEENNDIQIKPENYIDEFGIEIENSKENEKYQGYIPVDYSTFSFTCFNTFKQICNNENLDLENTLKEIDCTIVDLPNGIYEATCLLSNYKKEDFVSTIATIKKIEDL